MLAALVASAALSSWALGQYPDKPIGGFPSQLPQAPANPVGTQPIGGFIKNLGNLDAGFEVLLGQGRLITLEEDLVVQGQSRPILAVGDPSVLDVEVLGPRQLRVIGQRLGVTDLSVTTAEKKVYTIQIQVVADLHVLEAQLKALFQESGAAVTLRQIRDHVVVEGRAPSFAVKDKIIEAVRSYLSSIRATQERNTAAATAVRQETPPGVRRPAGAPGAPMPRAEDNVPPVPRRPPADAAADVSLGEGTTATRTTSVEPQVIDLIQVPSPLEHVEKKMRLFFPDASIRLGELGGQIVVEGQARDAAQVQQILDALRGEAAVLERYAQRRQPGTGGNPTGAPLTVVTPGAAAGAGGPGGATRQPESTSVINLLRVPGPQQVLLKVRIAELNRTSMREIGADFLAVDPDTGAIVGTQIGGATVSGVGTLTGAGLRGTAGGATTSATTVFGIFERADFEALIRALRRNTLLKILAEPNLVALNGHEASFLAGGEFPVPVPNVTGNVVNAITIQFREFGVKLAFVPTILDGENVRLAVAPEVSSIDFTLGTVLVSGGTPVPGLNTRKSQTTVELRQGQTLAIAGLLQLTVDGTTARIPGLGDLPILGPFFTNTGSGRQEKELVVLVTPYLVHAMNPGDVPPTPGDEVNAPNDLEFYLLGRIEGRTGRDHRATTHWDDQLRIVRHLILEKKYVRGPCGFSE